jgi:hypothetical protein
LSKGGKLMTISPSHLKLKKSFLEFGCKLRPTIRNDILEKTMILKNMIKDNLAPLPIIVLVHGMK